jgi:hypothetical protein
MYMTAPQIYSKSAALVKCGKWSKIVSVPATMKCSQGKCWKLPESCADPDTIARTNIIRRNRTSTVTTASFSIVGCNFQK